MKFLTVLVLLTPIVCFGGGMHQDENGSWVNEAGGNIYGDSRTNMNADPRINLDADPKVNLNADPRLNYGNHDNDRW